MKSYKIIFDLSRKFKYIKKIFKKLISYFFIVRPRLKILLNKQPRSKLLLPYLITTRGHDLHKNKRTWGQSPTWTLSYLSVFTNWRPCACMQQLQSHMDVSVSTFNTRLQFSTKAKDFQTPNQTFNFFLSSISKSKRAAQIISSLTILYPTRK